MISENHDKWFNDIILINDDLHRSVVNTGVYILYIIRFYCFVIIYLLKFLNFTLLLLVLIVDLEVQFSF